MDYKFKCSLCEFKKEIDVLTIHQPICNKCYSPMILEEINIKKEE